MIGLVVAGAGLVALGALGARAWLRGLAERRGARRMGALLSAATAGDTERLRRTVEAGVCIDQPDRQGNSALHHAFYTGGGEAIAGLRAFGADEGLRNREGLTPPEMAEVAAVEGLLRKGAACVTGAGDWTDEARARRIYERLCGRPPRIYNPALVRLVRTHQNRRLLLILAIKVGTRGSEAKLVEVLDGFGHQEMAVDYLNAGSPALREAAERWARRNGYRIFHRSGLPGVIWGRF